jgi:hypothetical protein
MPYERTIVCLANSYKHGGRCVAGLKVENGIVSNKWLRPVSDRENEELSPAEMTFGDGSELELLDLVDTSLIRKAPRGHQTENRLIDASVRWIRRGRLKWDDLDSAVEPTEAGLWIDGFHSRYGINDYVPESKLGKIDSSLILAEAWNFRVFVRRGGPYNHAKVRGDFKLDGRPYSLAVTDPRALNVYQRYADGEYEIGTVRLCVSLPHPFNGSCYKLIAGIIKP